MAQITIPIPQFMANISQKTASGMTTAGNYLKAPMSTANIPRWIPKMGGANVGDVLTRSANAVGGTQATGVLVTNSGNIPLGTVHTLKGGIAATGAKGINALKSVPKGFVVIPMALETISQVDDVIEGVKQGRGGAQIANSACDVAGVGAGAWAGAATGAAVGATVFGFLGGLVGTFVLPGVGTVACGAAGAKFGAWAGGFAGSIFGIKGGKKVGSAAGKFCFGENQTPQAKQAAVAQPTMQLTGQAAQAANVDDVTLQLIQQLAIMQQMENMYAKQNNPYAYN